MKRKPILKELLVLMSMLLMISIAASAQRRGGGRGGFGGAPRGGGFGGSRGGFGGASRADSLKVGSITYVIAAMAIHNPKVGGSIPPPGYQPSVLFS